MEINMDNIQLAAKIVDALTEALDPYQFAFYEHYIPWGEEGAREVVLKVLEGEK
jgi:hypothetical protein